jgi:hypothetical protein
VFPIPDQGPELQSTSRVRADPPASETVWFWRRPCRRRLLCMITTLGQGQALRRAIHPLAPAAAADGIKRIRARQQCARPPHQGLCSHIRRRDRWNWRSHGQGTVQEDREAESLHYRTVGGKIWACFSPCRLPTILPLDQFTNSRLDENQKPAASSKNSYATTPKVTPFSLKLTSPSFATSTKSAPT